MKALDAMHRKKLSSNSRMLYLDNIRAIAIIMVIGVHALSYCIELLPGQEKIIRVIVQTIAVPVFFLVDGYLLAYTVRLKKYSYLKVIKNSSYRLLMPWVLFTFLYTILRFFFEYFGVLGEKRILGHPWQDVLLSAYSSVYAPQLYFLVSLFFVRLCSPLLKYLFLKINFNLSLLLFIIYMSVYITIKPFILNYLNIEYGNEPLLHAIWGLQFYLLGILVFRLNTKISIRVSFFTVLISFIVYLSLQIDSGAYSNILRQYLYLLSVFYFFALMNDDFSILQKIGENTMGIYVLHAPVLLKIISILVNKYFQAPMISYLMILFLTALASFYLTILINKLPYGSLLFGIKYNK